MNADYTISDPRFGFDGYPFLFVSVHDNDDLGMCAVQGYQDKRVLLTPNVTPVDVDAYETTGYAAPFWIEVDKVYGVSWRSMQFRDDWKNAMEKCR